MSRYLEITKRYRARSGAEPLNEQQLDETVCNLLALTPEQREQYRRELELATPDDPWLEHDVEALRRAEELASAKEATNVA